MNSPAILTFPSSPRLWAICNHIISPKGEAPSRFLPSPKGEANSILMASLASPGAALALAFGSRACADPGLTDRRLRLSAVLESASCHIVLMSGPVRALASKRWACTGPRLPPSLLSRSVLSLYVLSLSTHTHTFDSRSLRPTVGSHCLLASPLLSPRFFASFFCARSRRQGIGVDGGGATPVRSAWRPAGSLSLPRPPPKESGGLEEVRAAPPSETPLLVPTASSLVVRAEFFYLGTFVFHAGRVLLRPRPTGPRMGDSGFPAPLFTVTSCASFSSVGSGGFQFTSMVLAPVLLLARHLRCARGSHAVAFSSPSFTTGRSSSRVLTMAFCGKQPAGPCTLR